jgi:hypothetical protein
MNCGCKVRGAINNVGKGAKEDNLPSRFAKDTITGATDMNRYRNNYSKNAPKLDQFGGTFMMGRIT